MSYPAGWDLVNITGTYIARDGTPCTGSVTLSSPQLVLRSGTIVPAADIIFDLVNGTFSGQIPATDDPNAQPSGWVYTVTENVPGGRQGYQIVAPHTSPGIDLSTVIPVLMPMPPTFGFPYVTLSQLAAPGGSALIGYLQAGTGAVTRTVQSRLREIISVLDFGADPTGVADSTTAIQEAINAAQSLGGGIVRFCQGVFKVSSTLTISSSNVVMEGQGGNTPHDAGTNGAATTLIQWAGGASTVIDVRTPNLSTIAIQTGMGVCKLEVDGNATATTGISVTSIRKGIFEDLHVQNCVTQSYLVTTYTKASMSEPPDTQQCYFRQCGWRNVDTAPVQGAHGFVLTSAAPGTAAANTSYNEFYNCQGQSYNGEGFYMIDADNNVLTQCGAFIVTPGTGYSLFVDGAYSNYFIGFGGASRIRGTASGVWQNTTSNVFLCVDEANGSPYPVIDTNCSVQWHGSLYGFQILRATTGIFSGSTARTTAALAALGNYSMLLDSANQQHAILTDGTNAFDVVIDTNGYLRFRNVGGGGGFFFYGSVRFTGGTAAPTSGTWQTADLVWNTTPSVLGTSGSQYIIDHWRCVSGGTPGTWVACRTLTGT